MYIHTFTYTYIYIYIRNSGKHPCAGAHAAPDETKLNLCSKRNLCSLRAD